MHAKIPDDRYINIDTISNDIDKCVNDFTALYGINIYDAAALRSIPHNTINNLFRYIYKSLFEPDIKLKNHQRSLIDYNNIQLLTVIANKFIDICLLFNKSLGLMSFSLMTGIHYNTLYSWLNNENLNPALCEILQNIQECHKMQQIGLLNDTPVGALAVANNDKETGLEWAKQQQQLQAVNTVYLIPSERSGRLALTDQNNG